MFLSWPKSMYGVLESIFMYHLMQVHDERRIDNG